MGQVCARRAGGSWYSLCLYPAESRLDASTLRGQFGGLDIVVANAGLDEGLGPVLDVTEADYDRLFNVNAKGAFFALQKAADRRMGARR